MALLLTANAVNILSQEITEKGRRVDGVQYVPTMYLKKMTWGGTQGVLCKYSFIISDGVHDLPMQFTTIPEYRKALYSLIHGKKKRMVLGSVVRLQKFHLYKKDDGTPYVIAHAIRIMKRDTDLV